MMFWQKWLSQQRDCVFTHVAAGRSSCKWSWGEQEEGRERRAAYWGQQRALLSVISIQMCRIRYSERAAAQGWKWVVFHAQLWSHQGQIQTNEFTQTLHVEHWIYKRQKQLKDVELGGLLVATPPILLPHHKTKLLSAFYFRAASGWLSHFICRLRLVNFIQCCHGCTWNPQTNAAVIAIIHITAEFPTVMNVTGCILLL